MAQNNRKRRTARLVFPVRTAAIVVIGATLALAYVWLGVRSEMLGARIKQLEQEGAEIQKRHDNELWKWEIMTSPSNIEEVLGRHEIVMIWPDETSIVRLYETDISEASLQGLAGQVAQLAQLRRSVADD